MDKISILIIITAISLIISLILALFLFTVKTTNKASNLLFAIFLLVTAIDISEPIFNEIFHSPSNLRMFRNTFAFIQIPVFYVYVLSVCYSDFKLKTRHLLHFIPFLISNLILFPRFYSVGVISKINFLKNHLNMIELQFNHILIHIQFIIYFIVVFIILKKAKKLYLENYAGININSYNWLFQFTIVLTILYLIALFKNIFKFADYSNISEWLKIGLLILQLFITCWYLFKALNNPHLFRNIDSKLKLVSDIVLEVKNNNQVMAIEKEFNSTLLKLKNYMIEKKPFLNPSITIQNISDDINIPVRDLSLLINHKLGQHFFDFINTYRIEQAMIILKDSAKKDETILEILYEVGFNSKSSFNTAFKKHTGTTPTSYRKQL
ncbi:helix-turn-helix domain-containing protein [Flavobacterium psychrophilum]|uniref:helix-turn-helix domain-containing protein n=1 Tax=Flavobacterium psychrophilum TaxID=96345 RepID=UPI000B7C143E|nr:helix-turn-helix domain-containing protein [Flavobacterium psychrophilum]SNB18172.1 DNA-binding domain-containing protein, AraC-type [Flavobacterium psychrophilum]SNB38959.1 DNA-binding domain-containing protein, AraC-type [Flavobacterium psychrophilum]